jgi:hypothetical protein
MLVQAGKIDQLKPFLPLESFRLRLDRQKSSPFGEVPERSNGGGGLYLPRVPPPTRLRRANSPKGGGLGWVNLKRNDSNHEVSA